MANNTHITMAAAAKNGPRAPPKRQENPVTTCLIDGGQCPKQANMLFPDNELV
jgi:hypothetical protein